MWIPNARSKEVMKIRKKTSMSLQFGSRISMMSPGMNALGQLELMSYDAINIYIGPCMQISVETGLTFNLVQWNVD